MMPKIVLGTVQFGMSYGVANQVGMPKVDQVKAILSRAKEIGINRLDTASVYGKSEAVLGKIGIGSFKITTKIPPILNDVPSIKDFLTRKLENSLSNLDATEIDTLLIHDSLQLADNILSKEILDSLNYFKSKGVVKKIGISIYDPLELDNLTQLGDFDTVQCPYNVFDRRFKDSGWIKKLKRMGIEIQVRSIFLQGLLLMSGKNRPSKFNKWKDIWNEWDSWLLENRCRPLEVCLGFVFQDEDIDSVVLGVDSLGQLNELFSTLGSLTYNYPINIKAEDINLINPVFWNKIAD